ALPIWRLSEGQHVRRPGGTAHGRWTQAVSALQLRRGRARRAGSRAIGRGGPRARNLRRHRHHRTARQHPLLHRTHARSRGRDRPGSPGAHAHRFGSAQLGIRARADARRVGAVICWENSMPLLRQAMYAKGVELYCAPTVDDRPTWTATMTHIALEGRTHVLSACQYITKDAYPDDHPFEVDLPYGSTAIRGGSVIVAPTGEVLAGPVYDEETILYADIDPDAKTRSHLDFDVVGHYSRPDVFELTVHSEPRSSVSFD